MTIEKIQQNNGSRDQFFLVKDAAGEIIGMLRKAPNTRTDINPWKAWMGHGLNAKFIGSFYALADAGKLKGSSDFGQCNFGGKNEAVAAIVAAAGR